MTRTNTWKGVLAAATAAALTIAGLVLAATPAAAISGSLTVESATLPMGEEGTIEVVASVPAEPGLGAWTVDVIVEDPDVVAVLDCAVPSHSVCNPTYSTAPPIVRYAGAVAQGIVGETSIGTFAFACLEEGTTVLELSTTGFADGTLGGPVEIAATHNLGTITCTEEAVSGPTPDDDGDGDGDDDGGGPAGMTPPASLPDTGTGASGDSSLLATVIATLSLVGVTGVTGALAVRKLRFGAS